MPEMPERASAHATIPSQAKAEDLSRVTEPKLWLAAVLGLYLNIMRPRYISCTTASMGMLLDWMMSLL
jgi:hypothetical protein